jgi:hypothetical protein
MARFNVVIRMKIFFQWCTKPPQAIVVVLLLAALVLGMSFYAGRLKRELSSHPAAASVAAPHG